MNRFVLLVFLLLSSRLFAETVTCNSAQTQCEFDSKDFTIGDQMGIFSDDGDLVARGTIKGMDGRKRKVTITKKYGPIKNGNTIKLMNSGDSDVDPKDVKVFQKPSKWGGGGDLFIGSANMGAGVTMLGFEGFGFMRWTHEIEIVGRFGYTNLDGQVTRAYDVESTQTVPFTGSLFNFIGGVGYTAFKRETFSFRSEIDLGLSYLSAAVNGKPDEVDGAGYTTRVKNGIGLLIKAGASGLYNRGDWHFAVNAGLGVIQGATFWCGGVGLIRDIR